MRGALEKAVRGALAAVTDARDAAAVELAATYAERVDLGDSIEKIGPALLATLESLLMTPRARAALVKGAIDEPKPSPLDELKQRRAQRSAG